MTQSEIIEYVNRIFNYYNGKINTVIRARLDINLLGYISKAGENISPNVVVIYPYAIKRYLYNMNRLNDENLKYLILEVIIHELFHADQYIILSKYNTDEKYRKMIETTADAEVYKYLMNNADEVYLLSGSYYNRDITTIEPSSYYGLFTKTTLKQHFIKCIRDLLCVDDIYELLDSKEYFTICIYSKSMVYREFIDFNKLTYDFVYKFYDITYELYYKYDETSFSRKKYKDDYNGDITIIINNVHGVNTMCNTIKI